MKISNNCFAITGLYCVTPWSVNAGFIVGDKKTLVIDAGSNYISARTIYGYAKTAKPSNEMMLINTEKHLDHIGGNGLFRENNVDIYGHFLLNRKQEDLANWIVGINGSIAEERRRHANEGAIAFEKTEIVNPNCRIEKEGEIDLGGIAAKVLMTTGHTDTNISVYCEQDNVLFCGDCIVQKLIPNIEEDGIEMLNAWGKSLEKIAELQPDILVPGHGDIIYGKNILEEIERTRKILTETIKAKGKRND
ncbi:MAG TPA: MBL fold metallo-hydrolase [Patescibacteria group bacterium]|nr:MBL fold metallo-hydrolase [Patescibacteria group bacterium]